MPVGPSVPAPLVAPAQAAPRTAVAVAGSGRVDAATVVPAGKAPAAGRPSGPFGNTLARILPAAARPGVEGPLRATMGAAGPVEQAPLSVGAPERSLGHLVQGRATGADRPVSQQPGLFHAASLRAGQPIEPRSAVGEAAGTQAKHVAPPAAKPKPPLAQRLSLPQVLLLTASFAAEPVPAGKGAAEAAKMAADGAGRGKIAAKPQAGDHVSVATMGTMPLMVMVPLPTAPEPARLQAGSPMASEGRRSASKGEAAPKTALAAGSFDAAGNQAAGPIARPASEAVAASRQPTASLAKFSPAPSLTQAPAPKAGVGQARGPVAPDMATTKPAVGRLEPGQGANPVPALMQNVSAAVALSGAAPLSASAPAPATIARPTATAQLTGVLVGSGPTPAVAGNVASGTRLTIAMAPPAIGMVSVRIDTNVQGNAVVAIAATHPATLVSLRNDHVALQQMLTQAGIAVDHGAISFHLEPSHAEAGSVTGQIPFGQGATGNGATGQGGFTQRGSQPGRGVMGGDAPAPDGGEPAMVGRDQAMTRPIQMRPFGVNMMA